MKKRTLKLLTVLSGLLLLGCYPKGAEYVEDLDIVITKNNDQFDFSAKSTYAMPDSIVAVTGNVIEGELPEFIPNAYAGPMLDRIASNMKDMGYERVGVDENPDLLLKPAAWETTTVYYYYDYWYWWYGGYYPYWGYYPPVYYSSYSTGTLFWTLTDPNEVSADGNPIIQWSAAINGLLTYSYDLSRSNKGIDQAFAQSPYLLTN